MASEWVNQEIGIAHGNHKPILPSVLEHGLSLPGFIKELRYVAAFQIRNRLCIACGKPCSRTRCRSRINKPSVRSQLAAWSSWR
jgi:hypothetical protein